MDVAVVSDYGFATVERPIFLNRVLRKNGFWRSMMRPTANGWSLTRPARSLFATIRQLIFTFVIRGHRCGQGVSYRHQAVLGPQPEARALRSRTVWRFWRLLSPMRGLVIPTGLKTIESPISLPVLISSISRFRPVRDARGKASEERSMPPSDLLSSSSVFGPHSMSSRIDSREVLVLSAQ